MIMARLMQTTNAKERVYAQSVSFFSTNDSVLTDYQGVVPPGCSGWINGPRH